MKAESSDKIMSEKQRRKNNKIIAAVMGFVLLCTGLYVFIYVIPGISGALTRTAVISYGNLKVTDVTKGFIIRNEIVFSANQTGSVSYYVEEGLKTRKDTKVLDIYPSNGAGVGYACPSTGVVSYFIDGYEAYFTPETLNNMQFSKLQELDVVPENTQRAKTERSEPIYKLILEDVWYIVVLVSDNNIHKYTVDSKVNIEFKDGEVDGYTTALVKKPEGWLAIIKTDKYYENFASIRQATVTVTTEDYQGLIVPNTAIAEKDGQPGVYVKDIVDDYHFTRIKIITTDGKYSLVHSATFYETNNEDAQIRVKTVEIYDEVLRNAISEE